MRPDGISTQGELWADFLPDQGDQVTGHSQVGFEGGALERSSHADISAA